MKKLSEHEQFLMKLRNDKIIIITFRILLLVVFIGAWELLSQTKLIDSFLFSSPTRVCKVIANLYLSGELFLHIGTTLYETFLGFIIATLLGTAISILLWWSEKIRKILEPYIVVLNSLPKIALGPLIIIWFGAGTSAIVFMAIIITIIVTIISMLNGFMETDSNKILLLKSMGATKLQIFLKLVLPSTLPTLISTLKINVGMSWIGSIMGEYLVSKRGLGYLIVYGGQVFKLDLVMASTVILCLLAALMYLVVSLFERSLIKWK